MAGGAIQLILNASQNVLLNGNPQISFFKKVYKRFTNFSMESISLPLSNTTCNVYERTTFSVKIDRHGDLINWMYFVFEIPDIISDSQLNFQWVENFAEILLNNYSITIGGSMVEKNYGENMHIKKNLGLSTDKQEIYDKLTGNTVQYTDPAQYILNSQKLNDIPLKYRIGSSYPNAIIAGSNGNPTTVSINGRKIYIPLTFWFNREIGTSLPMISLQYSEVYVNIELNPMYYIYRLLYNQGGVYDYYAPDIYNSSHRLINFVTNINANYMISDTCLDIKAYLEVNYCFLDNLERSYFAYKPLEYLIEQTTRVEYNTINVNSVEELVLQNPVKEIVWVLKRDDLFLKNDWFNFQDNLRHILVNAKILINGVERIAEKDSTYFSYMQAYQHHTRYSSDGIYLYSFAITPEDWQPSGALNASAVSKLQFPLKTRSPDNTSYNYDVVFYVTAINWVVINSGLLGLMYSL